MNKKLFLFFTSFTFYLICFAQHHADTSINLFFRTNGFELDTQQYHRIKAFISSYPSITQIVGYTDTFGTSAYNTTLSKKRALGVYKAIKNNIGFIDGGMVSYYGESEALPEPWMNRRVLIRASKPERQAFENTSIPADSAAIHLRDTIRIIDVENLYFLPDKPILSPESVPYIQQLAKQLKALPMATYEIVGHINYQSRFDSSHLKDLYYLSRQRAKAVYDYLLEMGIPAAKMTYRGAGNAQPVFINPKNDAEKRKNMRVQVIILKN